MIKLRDSDKKFLTMLLELRRSTPRELAQKLGYNGSYTYQRLTVLKDEENLVKKPSKGIYELTEKGKNYVRTEIKGEESLKDKMKLDAGVPLNKEGKKEAMISITMDEEKAKRELKELNEEINLEDYELLVKVEKELNKASLKDKFKEKLKI